LFKFAPAILFLLHPQHFLIEKQQISKDETSFKIIFLLLNKIKIDKFKLKLNDYSFSF